MKEDREIRYFYYKFGENEADKEFHSDRIFITSDFFFGF